MHFHQDYGNQQREKKYGPVLDGMTDGERIQLLAHDEYRQRLLRRFGTKSQLLRPDLLLALEYRDGSATGRQQTFEEQLFAANPK